MNGAVAVDRHAGGLLGGARVVQLAVIGLVAHRVTLGSELEATGTGEHSAARGPASRRGPRRGSREGAGRAACGIERTPAVGAVAPPAARADVRIVDPRWLPAGSRPPGAARLCVTDPDVRIELVDRARRPAVRDHRTCCWPPTRHVSPDHPMASLPEMLAQLRTERAAVTVETLVLYARDRAGRAFRLTLPQRDNTGARRGRARGPPAAPGPWPRPGAGGPPSRAARRARPDAGQHRVHEPADGVAEPGDAVRRRDRRHELARRGASGPGPHHARPRAASPPCGPRRRAGRATTTWSAGPAPVPTTWSRTTPP